MEKEIKAKQKRGQKARQLQKQLARTRDTLQWQYCNISPGWTACLRCQQYAKKVEEQKQKHKQAKERAAERAKRRRTTTDSSSSEEEDLLDIHTDEARTYGKTTFPQRTRKKKSRSTRKARRKQARPKPIKIPRTRKQKPKAVVQKEIDRKVGSKAFQKAGRARYQRSIIAARAKREATRSALEENKPKTSKTLRNAIIALARTASSIDEILRFSRNEKCDLPLLNYIEKPVETDAVQNDSRNNRRNENLFQATRNDVVYHTKQNRSSTLIDRGGQYRRTL